MAFPLPGARAESAPGPAAPRGLRLASTEPAAESEPSAGDEPPDPASPPGGRPSLKRIK
jgi:hypothetical protein